MSCWLNDSRFPTIVEVVVVHGTLIREFGGALDLRDAGALASTLMRPQLGYCDSRIEETAEPRHEPSLRGRQQANCLGCY